MIYTIGYEGLSTNVFWSLLESNSIEVLVDVRAVAWSRKPGFSKSALESECEQRGLGYIHLKPLGCPQPIRNSYKQDKNWSEYTRRFGLHLQSRDAALEAALESLESLVLEQKCALMCFEANPLLCHRSFVATEVSRRLHGAADSDALVSHLQRALVAA